MTGSIHLQHHNLHDQPNPPTSKECQHRLRSLQKEIHHLEKCAITICISKQEEMYGLALISHDKKTANALKFQILAERKASMFKKLQSIQSTTKTTLTKLEIP